MGNYELNDREHATVLAALRVYQDWLDERRSDPQLVEDIADNGGTVQALTVDEIDDLCVRLNCEGGA